MRLASADVDGQVVGVCSVSDTEVVTLSSLVPGLTSVKELIEGGESLLRRIRTQVQTNDPARRRLPIATLNWQPPVPNTEKVLCVALNNRALDHLAIEVSKYPTYFNKPVSSLIGHGKAIEVQAHYGLVHAEPELGVVIGRTAKRVSVESALDHVFGYTIVNDVTSPTMRREDHFEFRFPLRNKDGNGFTYSNEHTTYPARYKGADTFGPMGPWLVTKDDVRDPHNLAVFCWFDDEQIMADSTQNLRFSVAEVIYWISAHCTLQPGDIISMGTALSGDKEAKPISYGDMNRFGNQCRIAIDGLGEISNPIRRANGDDPRTHFQS